MEPDGSGSLDRGSLPIDHGREAIRGLAARSAIFRALPGTGDLSDPALAAAWLARNAVDCLPAGELERRLRLNRPLRVKLGIDPTAPDIHLGFTVVHVRRRGIDAQLHPE